jgi:hypothetical protein
MVPAGNGGRIHVRRPPETNSGWRFLVPYPVTSRGSGRAGPAKCVAVELAAQLADMSRRAIGEHYRVGPMAPRSEPSSVQDATRCVERGPDAGGATADKETKVFNAGETLMRWDGAAVR